MVRSAFMLDHQETSLGDCCWRWTPPESVLQFIETQIPHVGDNQLPPRVFLALIDALATNEDAKYNPTGVVSGGKGRQNTLLTCANVIGVVLDRVPIYKVFGGLANARGVCPITQSDARTVFPLLQGRVWSAEGAASA